MPIYHRTVTDNDSGEVYHFASVDSDTWLEVDSKPSADCADHLVALIEGEYKIIMSRWFSFGPGDWGTASEVEEVSDPFAGIVDVKHNDPWDA